MRCATPHTWHPHPPQILRDVPAHLFPHFTFYNVPAPADLRDGRSPLAVMAKLAKPEDFVSIKVRWWRTNCVRLANLARLCFCQSGAGNGGRRRAGFAGSARLMHWRRGVFECVGMAAARSPLAVLAKLTKLEDFVSIQLSLGRGSLGDCTAVRLYVQVCAACDL